MGQARTEDERAFVEQLYEHAIEEGPDFINYRSKSAFEAAPRLGIDRNAYARILNALDMIERGTYRHAHTVVEGSSLAGRTLVTAPAGAGPPSTGGHRHQGD